MENLNIEKGLFVTIHDFTFGNGRKLPIKQVLRSMTLSGIKYYGIFRV